MAIMNKTFLLGVLPTIPSVWILLSLIENPFRVISGWIAYFSKARLLLGVEECKEPPTVGSQLLAYLIVAILGFFITSNLIPKIKVRNYFLIYFIFTVTIPSLFKLIKNHE